MVKSKTISLAKAAAILSAANGAGVDVRRIVDAFVDVLTGDQVSFTDEIADEFEALMNRFMKAPLATSLKAVIWYKGTLWIFRSVSDFIPGRKSIPIGNMSISLR